MAAGLVGTAYVKVTPDTSNFGSQLSGQMAPAAAVAGRSLSQRLTGAIGTGISASGAVMSRGLTSAFTGAQSMAANTGSRISSAIGSGVVSVLGPVARMRDGFVSSAVAGSRFSGLSGTIGGKLRTAVNAVGAGISGIGGMFSRSGATANAAIGGMTSGLGRMSGIMGGLAAGTAILGIGKQAFQAAAGIQQSTAALTGLYGNAAEATDMIGRLRKMAAGSPIEFAAFRSGAESLAYMGYRGDQATGILNNITRALVGAGKGSESVQQVTDAMLSMQNQGRATAEDVNRISQAGIPAWEALATHAGMSIEEVRKATEKGQISIEDMVAAIQDASGPTFDKLLAASDQASGTFTNTWKRVKDNVVTSLGAMMTGLLTQFGPALEGLGNTLAVAMERLPGILAQIGTFLAPLIGVFQNIWRAAQPFLQGFGVGFLGTLMAIGTAIQSVLGPALQWVTGLFAAWTGNNTTLLQVLGFLAGSLVALVAVVKTVTTVVNLAKGAMVLLNGAMSASPMGLVLAAITALVGGFIYLWNTSAGFRDFWIGLWNVIRDAAVGVWNFLLGFFQGVWNTIIAIGTGVWNGFAAFFSGLWTGVKNIIVGAWNAIGSFLSGAWNGIINGARSAFTGLLGFFRSLPGNILSAIGNVGGLLINAGKSLLIGLWNGIASLAGWLWQRVKDFFGNLLPGWVRSMLGISSPSRVFASLGRYTMQGFGEGIADGGDEVVKTAQSVANRVSAIDTAMDARVNLDTNMTGANATMRQKLQTEVDSASIADKVGEALAQWGLTLDGDQIAVTVNKANQRRVRRA